MLDVLESYWYSGGTPATADTLPLLARERGRCSDWYVLCTSFCVLVILLQICTSFKVTVCFVFVS